MIGSAEEQTAKKQLTESLLWFKKNIDACGSIDMLKAKYAAGYKRVYSKCVSDANAYLQACLQGYKVDPLIGAEEIAAVWGDNSKKINRIIKTTFSAEDVTKVISDYLMNLQEAFDGLIYLVYEDGEIKQLQKEGKA